MMNVACHYTEDDVLAFVAGDLPDAELMAMAVHFGECDACREQAIPAHREEDPRLAHEHDEKHARDAGGRPGRHEIRGPVEADVGQRERHRGVQELRDLFGS